MASKRNEPCYCGSGKKYKRCHLIKEQAEKVKPYEADKDLRKYLSFKKCQAPNFMKSKCSKKIIKSHTVSKSSNLIQIAKNGHVYEFKKSFQTVHKNQDLVQLIGINNASTFFGFCSLHDKELFSPFEDEEFSFTNEQIFLLSYRALSREFYLKKSLQKFFAEKMIKEYDKGISDPSSVMSFQSKAETFIYGQDLAIKDLSTIKEKFDNDLKNKNFSDVQYYAIVIDKIPEIMSSGCWIPEIDFDDNALANLLNPDIRFHGIYVNTLAYKEEFGVILFSWNKKENINENYNFIESLDKISTKDKPKAILKWLFSCNENIYFAPKWWDDLPVSSQKILKKNFSDVWDTTLKLSDYKKFDFINWSILDIKTNIERQQVLGEE